jgi:predicted DNA-binding transcriptional regulator AlpA
MVKAVPGDTGPMTRADKAGQEPAEAAGTTQTVSATRFAQLTGVSRERLRTWERRHGFPEPVRIGSGPRRYALADAPRVVAVRHATVAGTPLDHAVAAVRSATPATTPPATAFRSAVELAPVPVALIAGPEPLELAWANAALRAIEGAPVAGDPLPTIAAHSTGATMRQHFARDLPATEIGHPPWGGNVAGPGSAAIIARSVLYRLTVAPGESPLLAVVGIESRGEHAARVALAEAEAELAVIGPRAERHDRWLDALDGLATGFQREDGPELLAAALDLLIRQTRAIDVGLASYLSGRVALHGTRRGVLAATALTVAAHPQLGQALRDLDGAWLDPASATALGVPVGLHAVGVPVAVAGEILGLLVMVFDEIEPLDADNRRLLSAVSAAVGFALLRDRLVQEVRASAHNAAAPGRGAWPPKRRGTPA